MGGPPLTYSSTVLEHSTAVARVRTCFRRSTCRAYFPLILLHTRCSRSITALLPGAQCITALEQEF